MGATVCHAVHADPELELVGGIDATERRGHRWWMRRRTRRRLDDRRHRSDDLAAAGAEVVVDFTIAPAARENLPAVAAAGMHAVVGTTGFSDEDIASLRSRRSRRATASSPANFAISAVLMMRFAEIAALRSSTPQRSSSTTTTQKIDAPSGTAVATAQRMAAASTGLGRRSDREGGLRGRSRRRAGPGGIRVHGVRMHGKLAHQDVILGAEGQTLTLRQDSYDRSSFMPGVVLACKRIADHPGLTIGLDALLEI